MGEKFDLEKMLAEIPEDEALDAKEGTELSQEDINRKMIERLRKRKAQDR